MGINSAMDWYWFVRDLDIPYGREAQEAYNFIVDEVIPYLIANNIPHEFIFDDVVHSTNLVVPKDYVLGPMKKILEEAGFIAKPVPEPDQQASADFKEALLKGANFNKRWN